MHSTGPMQGTIRIQPRPIKTMVLELNGVTSIVRIWGEGDPERCRLCPQGTCDAVMNVCAIQTDESVSDEAAPLYSCVGLDSASDTTRARETLGLAL